MLRSGAAEKPILLPELSLALGNYPDDVNCEISRYALSWIVLSCLYSTDWPHGRQITWYLPTLEMDYTTDVTHGCPVFKDGIINNDGFLVQRL